uniref:MULE transposase domain-containing protein n=1 Tax=Tanacetum cinerariifolium TaxID=118510 RepID=A0A6L2KMN6_TANCI|nr:hypothetical protein [Tanacetum cinerariifolium]
MTSDIYYMFYYLLFLASNSSKTPKAIIYHEFIDTPDGLVYWVPRVSASVLTVLGIVYDSLDECIEMEGCPNDVWLNTLDPKKNDILVEYKHLSKAERKLTYNEHLFIIKAANADIGVVRDHNLYTGLKVHHHLCMVLKLSSRTSYVALTALLEIVMLRCSLLGWNRGKSSQKTFSLTISLRMLSFVVYFRPMKLQSKITRSLVISYKMVFVPFTATENHKRSVSVGSGLLKKETTKSYDWLLRAFKKAFVRPPNIVMTDQDGVMRLAVAAEFPKFKHRLCMWHIM